MLTENLIGFVPDNYFPEEYRGQLRRIPIENTHHRFCLELKYLPRENAVLELFIKELSAYLKREYPIAFLSLRKPVPWEYTIAIEAFIR